MSILQNDIPCVSRQLSNSSSTKDVPTNGGRGLDDVWRTTDWIIPPTLPRPWRAPFVTEQVKCLDKCLQSCRLHNIRHTPTLDSEQTSFPTVIPSWAMSTKKGQFFRLGGFLSHIAGNSNRDSKQKKNTTEHLFFLIHQLQMKQTCTPYTSCLAVVPYNSLANWLIKL